jgi:hypothetical protein
MPADVSVVLLAEQAGGDALEGVDQLGELDLRRVVHQEVHVILFAVELLQLGLEVGADLPHDLLTPGQHGVGERVPPVLRGLVSSVTYFQAWKNCWDGRAEEPAFKARIRTVMSVDIPQGRDLQIKRVHRRWGMVNIPKVGRVRFRWTRDLPVGKAADPRLPDGTADRDKWLTHW